MKRIVLVAAVLLGGMAAAHADKDIYNNTQKVPRGDFELHADTAACDQQYGAPKNGAVTSRVYKRCMFAGLAVRPHRAGEVREDVDRSRDGTDVPRSQNGRHGDWLGVFEFLGLVGRDAGAIECCAGEAAASRTPSLTPAAISSTSRMVVSVEATS